MKMYLYFIYDKDRLINDSKPDLQKVITYMKNNPSMNIILEEGLDAINMHVTDLGGSIKSSNFDPT